MEELLLDYGLTGLFILSFLAATFLPVVSEAALAALILAGMDPYACVAAAPPATPWGPWPPGVSGGGGASPF